MGGTKGLPLAYASYYVIQEIMINWTKEFETGSEKLDQQHRMLIDHVNLLEGQLHTTKPVREEMEFAVHLVEYLEAYANIHFKDEEKCMESYRCPVHAQNQREHERFRGFVHNYKRLCELEGFKVELLSNLHEVIRTWIQEHILKVDTQLTGNLSPNISEQCFLERQGRKIPLINIIKPQRLSAANGSLFRVTQP